MEPAERLLEPIRELHDQIRSKVVDACARQSADQLSAVASDGPGDTIYRIDTVGEAMLVEGLTRIALEEPLYLIAEGLPQGGIALPRGASEGDCRWRVLVDPIDGTRGLMYQKRSAWILTGVAPNRGAGTRLADITVAIQTEIPLLKQHLSDQLWAVRGKGAGGRRYNRLSGESERLRLVPSAAKSINHGYASIVKFFPGTRGTLGALDDALARRLTPSPEAGKAESFEDQYASTGGQLYELMAGHDRFIADLRPLADGQGLCCHPYDICTALIARELGVELTDAAGKALDAPMDLPTNVAWIGYANAELRAAIEPVLLETMARHNLGR